MAADGKRQKFRSKQKPALSLVSSAFFFVSLLLPARLTDVGASDKNFPLPLAQIAVLTNVDQSASPIALPGRQVAGAWTTAYGGTLVRCNPCGPLLQQLSPQLIGNPVAVV